MLSIGLCLPFHRLRATRLRFPEVSRHPRTSNRHPQTAYPYEPQAKSPPSLFVLLRMVTKILSLVHASALRQRRSCQSGAQGLARALSEQARRPPISQLCVPSSLLNARRARHGQRERLSLECWRWQRPTRVHEHRFRINDSVPDRNEICPARARTRPSSLPTSHLDIVKRLLVSSGHVRSLERVARPSSLVLLDQSTSTVRARSAVCASWEYDSE